MQIKADYFYLITWQLMNLLIIQSRSTIISSKSLKSFFHFRCNRNSYNFNYQHSLFSSNNDIPDEKKIDYSSDLQYYKASFPDISSSQWLQLEKLCYLLADWNTKVNLVSRKDIVHLVDNHVIPSLAISLVYNFSKEERVIDVGTGGGFPGLPLSIISPNVRFTLLDSNGKKMKVVQDLVNKLDLSNVKVIISRAEVLKDDKFDLLLGRAVSAIPNFLGFSSHLLDYESIKKKNPNNSGLLYLKGGDFIDELKEACIENSTLRLISDLIPSLQTDKGVLCIPAKDVFNFRVKKGIV